MDLKSLAMNGAGVEHDDGAVGKEGGGASPDAVDVVPLVWEQGRGKEEPIDEVARYGVAPCDIAPHC